MNKKALAAMRSKVVAKAVRQLFEDIEVKEATTDEIFHMVKERFNIYVTFAQVKNRLNTMARHKEVNKTYKDLRTPVYSNFKVKVFTQFDRPETMPLLKTQLHEVA